MRCSLKTVDNFLDLILLIGILYRFPEIHFSICGIWGGVHLKWNANKLSNDKITSSSQSGLNLYSLL